MDKRILIGLILLVGLTTSLSAQVPLVTRPNSEKTLIAPAYFGPNAFPVPDMLDGRAGSALRIDVAGDGYLHDNGKDKTADIFARVHIPLFTDLVNLTVWYPIHEWYRQNDTTGHGAGDIYVSTDIWIFKARKWTPDFSLRAAIKTASGGQFEKARHFDAPGYWFDGSVGKSFYIKDLELRFSGTLGFLCWQTDNGRQNDALYYGLQGLIQYKYVSARVTWSGYNGWEYAGDRPMTIQVRLAGHIQGFEPYVQYQKGLRDYPYRMVRVGLVYNWDIVKPSKVRELHRKDGSVIEL